MALKKPQKTVDSAEALAFIADAASQDTPTPTPSPRETRPRRKRPHVEKHSRIVLTLPPHILSEIDLILAGTGTPRVVWIRQAILAAMKNERAEKLAVGEGIAWVRAKS